RRNLLGGLSRRQGLVFADEVASVVPAASGRPCAQPFAGFALRRPRFLMTAGLKPVSKDRLRDFLNLEAKRQGFDAIAVASPDSVPLAPGRLAHYVDKGRHGTMEWLAETASRRGDPRTLWPDVRSIVMLAMNYGPDADPLGLLARKDRAAISVY